MTSKATILQRQLVAKEYARRKELQAFPDLPYPVSYRLAYAGISTDAQLFESADTERVQLMRGIGDIRLALIYAYLVKRFPDQAERYQLKDST